MTRRYDERRVICDEEVEVALYPGQPPRRYRLRIVVDPNPEPRHITGTLPDGYLAYVQGATRAT